MSWVEAQGRCEWKKPLLRGGWWLAESEWLRQVQRGQGVVRPLPDAAMRLRIVRYSQLLQEIETLRRCWKRTLPSRQQGPKRRQHLAQTAQMLREALERAVLPLWIGTTWDFYGTAETPHRGTLACGYFVVQALRAVGFRFRDHFYYRHVRRGRMHIFEFAKLHAFGMVRLLAHPSQITQLTGQPPQAMLQPLLRYGAGLYLLGLDHHVGIVLFDGAKAAFWHSDYRALQAWVKREDLFRSPTVRLSRIHLLGKVSTSTLENWLLGREIRVAK